MTARNTKIKSNNLLIIILILSLSSSVDCQYLDNPSLEGSLGTDFPPPGWAANGETWANPDNIGQNDDLLPYDGESFTLFRARGLHFEHRSFPERFPALTREYLFQELPLGLQINSCYEFKAWLAFNPEYSYPIDHVHPDTAYPLRFQVWGGNHPDLRQQLLLDTEPVSNTEWKEYSTQFTIWDNSYTHLLIEVAWDTLNVISEPYPGWTFADNLSLEYLGPSISNINHTVYFTGDNELSLIPVNEGSHYQWVPERFVSDPSSRETFVTQFNDSIVVYIGRDDGCDLVEVFHLKLDCDSIKRANIDTNFYYKYVDGLSLIAADGDAWNWSPEIYLSESNVRSPFLLGYNEFYTVRIRDAYGCDFFQKFNINIHCDSLVAGGELVTIDTLVSELIELPLEVKYGEANSAWSPPLYLDCNDCDIPKASPRSSISYFVNARDSFNCEHVELISVEIPLNIPNVITPNEDGVNDCFLPFGLPRNTTFHLYDKMGNSLCSIPDFEMLECWNGIDDHGNELSSGTYWYAFENISFTHPPKGFLLIKR